MPRHILIKLTQIKHKERILKAAREKQQVTYKGNPIHLTTDLSAETLQARMERQDILKVLKGEKSTTKITVPSKNLIITDGEIKSFSDKQKLREFSTTKTALRHFKQTYIVKKYNKRKKIYKINPKQLENGNKNIYVNNYFKCKWIKFSNLKTQDG